MTSLHLSQLIGSAVVSTSPAMKRRESTLFSVRAGSHRLVAAGAAAPVVLDDGDFGSQDCEICTPDLRLVDPDEARPILHHGAIHEGRHPEGLRTERGLGLGPTPGDLLAQQGHNERAAFHAYRLLARDLRRVGAPARLGDRVYRAAREEVRHTRMLEGLASYFGGERRLAELDPSPPRSIAELARDNLVQGCIQETFTAAVCLWQANTAGHPRLRSVMAEIAADEAEHAQLAWDLHRWLCRQLDDADVEGLHTLARQAVDRLALRPAPLLSPDTRRIFGMPEPRQAQKLARRLFSTLI